MANEILSAESRDEPAKKVGALRRRQALLEATLRTFQGDFTRQLYFNPSLGVELHPKVVFRRVRQGTQHQPTKSFLPFVLDVRRPSLAVAGWPPKMIKCIEVAADEPTPTTVHPQLALRTLLAEYCDDEEDEEAGEDEDEEAGEDEDEEASGPEEDEVGDSDPEEQQPLDALDRFVPMEGDGAEVDGAEEDGAEVDGAAEEEDDAE
ncbi:MAG: hypothetical protein GY772_02820 [bacterium]|nr:hypothetical protein [bacterium]